DPGDGIVGDVGELGPALADAALDLLGGEAEALAPLVGRVEDRDAGDIRIERPEVDLALAAHRGAARVHARLHAGDPDLDDLLPLLADAEPGGVLDGGLELLLRRTLGVAAQVLELAAEARVADLDLGDLLVLVLPLEADVLVERIAQLGIGEVEV